MGITQGGFGSASWFRFAQFIPYFDRAGWKVEHRPGRLPGTPRAPIGPHRGHSLPDHAASLLARLNRLRDSWDCRKSDVIFANRDSAAEWLFFHRILGSLPAKTVYDLDEPVFEGLREHSVRWMCSNSRWVTSASESLARYARRFTDRVTVIPTVIDTDRFKPASTQSQRGAITRIGWSGSAESLETTLLPRLEVLRDLQKSIPFRLIVLARHEPPINLDDLDWEFQAWNPDEEPAFSGRFDIGIVPFAEKPIEDGNFGLKILQYMAAGLPVVASPGADSSALVCDGETGSIAKSDAEWHQELWRLLSNANLRFAMGSAARERCVAHFSIQRWLPVILGIFETVRHEELAA